MPYELRQTGNRWQLRLWPHNALAPRGFAAVIGATALVLALPLLAVLGSAVLWGILPFAGLALTALWLALRRNWRDRSTFEEMELSRQSLHLRHIDARGQVLEWRADPHWVALHLRPRGGPVEHYLTLTGANREVELGTFLTPEERVVLHGELQALLNRLKTYA